MNSTPARFRSWRLVLNFVLALAFFAVGFAAGGVPTTNADYGTRLRAAQQLAAEGSWTLARDAFAAARPLAPTDDARRWCDLWLIEATWRGEGRPLPGPERSERLNQYLTVFAELLAPYANGQPRDAFWAEAMEKRAALRANFYDPKTAWDELVEIAAWLAAQPPTHENAANYVAFLRRILTNRDIGYSAEHHSSLFEHLANAERVAPTPDDRAWFALQTASVAEGQISRERQAFLWAQALKVAPGTRWEARIRAGEFFFRTINGWSPDAAPGTPADLPALLRELAGVRAALDDAAPDTKSPDTLKKLDALQTWWNEPMLQLHAPALVRPGAAAQFSYGEVGHRDLTAEIYRYTLKTWMGRPKDTADLVGDKSRLDAPDAYENLAGHAELVRTWTIALPAPDDRRWHSGTVDLPSLEPGFYTLEVRETASTTPQIRRQHFLVTGIDCLPITTPSGPVSLYFYRADTGEPVAAAETDTIRSIGIDSRSEHAVTDATGLVSLPSLAGIDVSNYTELSALVGGHPVSLKYTTQAQRRTPEIVADYFLDRELYRPGETVHWQLIVRERRNGQFVVPNRKLRMSINLPESPPCLTNIELDEFGTAHGQFVIPPNSRPGVGGFTLGLAEDASNPVTDPYTAFLIDNYVPPATQATIELASQADTLRPGGEIAVRVRATYNSGGPLVASKADCTFSDKGAGTYSSSNDPRTIEWLEALRNKTFSGNTDSSGAVEFRLPLPSYLPDGFALRVDATVTPQGGQAAKTSHQFKLNSAGAVVDPLGWEDLRPARPGDKVIFTGRVFGGDDEPRSLACTAQLVEKSWSEAWLDPEGRVLTGDELAAARRRLVPTVLNSLATAFVPPPLPKPFKQLYAGYAEQAVAEVSIRTGIDGRFEIEFTLPHAGLFKLQLLRNSAKLHLRNNRGMDDSLSVLAADETTRSLPLKPRMSRLLGPEKLAIGTPLSLLAVLSEDHPFGWIVVEGEDSVVSRRVPLSGRFCWITVDDLPRFSTYGHASLTRSPDSNGRHWPELMARFSVTNPPNLLSVELRPANDETMLGAETTAHVKIKRADGTSPQAEFALAVSDEAVNAMTGREIGQPPAFSSRRLLQRKSRIDVGAVDNGISYRPDLARDPRPGVLLNSTESVLFAEEVLNLTPAVLAGISVEGIRPRSWGSSASFLSRKDQTTWPETIDIRRHLASTALWVTGLATDANGEASVTFRLPDNLTQWRLEAYAVGRDGDSFGRGYAFVRASLPFQARLQAPRFLIAGDTAETSAVLLNRTGKALTASAGLQASGAARLAQPVTHDRLTVAPGAETHTTWPLVASATGIADLVLTASTGSQADGMEVNLPVFPDGLPQEIVVAGCLAADAGSHTLTLPLPDKLDPAQTSVQIVLSPGHTAAILDALPYLVDYPYGCVEQTMNRFLPAVVARRALSDLGIPADVVERRALNRAGQAASVRPVSPVAGLARFDEVVTFSLARLSEAQGSDGGFGWWPDSSSSDPWMTAYVAWGLSLAQEAGVKLPDDLVDRTSSNLRKTLGKSHEASDSLAWALAAAARGPKGRPEEEKSVAQTYARVYAARDRLGPTGRACLALAAVAFGSADERAVLLRNLENGVQRTRVGDLGEVAHWGSTEGYWRATDGAVEATALTLLALLGSDPRHPLAEPAAQWLVLNRRSAHWQSTRDTGFAVLALARFASTSAGGRPDAEVEVLVNGRMVRRMKISMEALLEGPLAVAVDPSSLRAGDNRIELRRVSGNSPVFASALATAWAAGDTVKPAGHLAQIGREFARLRAQPTLSGAERLVAEPLPATSAAIVGEQVDVCVTLSVPSELEYLMVEVPKPAGCEPLNALSGWDARLRRVDANTGTGAANAGTGPEQPIYREERDDRSVFFLNNVAAGTWEIRFGMRATTPGNFRILPATAVALYVPEVRANSDARRMRIDDRPEPTPAKN